MVGQEPQGDIEWMSLSEGQVWGLRTVDGVAVVGGNDDTPR